MTKPVALYQCPRCLEVFVRPKAKYVYSRCKKVGRNVRLREAKVENHRG